MKNARPPDFEVHTSDRLKETAILPGVFVVSFSMLLFEMAVFQVVFCLTNYMLAVYSVAIALMGLIAGGVISFLLAPVLNRYDRFFYLLPLLVSVSIGCSILDVVIFNTVNYLYFYFCTFLVFLFSGMFISHSFALHDSFRVYAANMIGSGLGVIGVVVLVSAFLEENTLVISMFLPLAASFLFFQHGRILKFSLVVVCLVVMSITLVLNKDTAYFNFVRDSRPNRFSNSTSMSRNRDTEVWFLSRSSLSGRIDFTVPKSMDMPRSEVPEIKASVKKSLGIDSPWISTFINNRALDGVDVYSQEDSFPDVRLPSALFEDAAPSILIVGAAAQGVTKAAKALGKNNVTAVEINPAVVAAMTKDLAEYSQYAYRGLDLHVLDVRTYLKCSDKKFDMITLLNTHNFYIGYDPIPEYPFTMEAIRDYFSHLTDAGLIDVEELMYAGKTADAVEREIANFVRVMREDKITDDPERHLYVYAWRRSRYPPDWWFYQVLVKKRPFHGEEIARLNRWVQELGSEHMGTKVVFSAGDGSFTDDVVADAIKDEDFAPIVDDYPFNIAYFLKDFQAALNMMTCILAIIGLGILVLPLRRFVASARKARWSWLFVFYFMCSGFSYMCFEIYMFQKNQLYIGSIGTSLVITVSVMLIMSGIGSLVASRLSVKKQLLLIACVPVYILILGGASSYLFDWNAFWFESRSLRILMVFLLLGPVSFLMGVPFSTGMHVVRQKCGNVFANYMFAINGIAASLGTILSFNISIEFGFWSNLLISISLYFVILAIALVVLRDSTKLLDA
jgi:spermidine synthase